MIVGLPKEIKNNEHRVGLTPDSVSEISANGHDVFVETNCGQEIGFTNENYEAAGAKVLFSAAEVCCHSDIRMPRCRVTPWLKLPAPLDLWHLEVPFLL